MSNKPTLFLFPLLLILLLQHHLPVECTEHGIHDGVHGGSGDDKAAKILIAKAFKDADIEKLEYLCDTFGPRWPGLSGYTAALDWIIKKMQEEGLENVHGESVPNIPNWIRGKETLTLNKPRSASLAVLGLGRSVGTGAAGITAPALVVSSFAELTKRAAEAAGKIIVFNAPFTSYGETVQYRALGASAAAQVGGVAALIRSVTPYSLYTLHTGGMNYVNGSREIPNAAITVEDAELLARMQARGQPIELSLFMEARFGDPVTEKNLIAEVEGSERPQEVIVLGGHSDSWDVGTGAVDDGGGLYSAWDALTIIKQAVDNGDLPRPKRTIRVVLWANEELGTRGAVQYRADHEKELHNHIVAIESDIGNFQPTGFGLSDFHNNATILATVKEALSYLSGIGAGNLTVSADAGLDVDNSLLYPEVACMSLSSEGSSPVHGDPRGAFYFNYHHSHADTVTALSPEGLKASVAAFAVITYYLANM